MAVLVLFWVASLLHMSIIFGQEAQPMQRKRPAPSAECEGPGPVSTPQMQRKATQPACRPPPVFIAWAFLDAQHVPQVDAGDFSRMEIAHLGAVQLHAEDAVEAHFLQGGFHRGEVHRAVAQGPEGAHLVAALGLGQGVGVHVL